MKILAVDDQESVLTMLKRQIDCGRLGIERLDTASGAAKARELLMKSSYEIILCDIEMPGENGIELARWTLDRYPDAKLIFLTSHADISYMKEAISMHSFDYLFQPVLAEELEEAIRKAAVQYRMEEENRKYQEKGIIYQDYEDEILDLNLMKYLEGELKEEEIVRFLKRQKLETDQKKPVLPFLIRFHERREILRDFGVGLLKFSLGNILEELVEALGIKCFLVRAREDLYYGFFHSGQILEKDFKRDSLVQFLKPFREISRNIFDVTVTIYLYERISAHEARKACVRLTETMEEDADHREIYLVSEHSKRSVQTGERHVIPGESWKRFLNSGEFHQLEKSIERYVGELRRLGEINVMSLVEVHKVFNENLLSYIAEREIDSALIFTEELSYQKYMLSYHSCEDFLGMVHYVVQRLLMATDQSPDAVDRAVKFIRVHLAENLSVTEISSSVGMSAEYLTRLFRKKMGTSLKAYLTAEKMKMAKMLLRTTDLSVTMISDHTGYDNYNNFIRVFKRCENMTPAEYRKQFRGDGES